ncbi:NtaA/DmoA family FMN-dependent monooxygenase [Rhodococcus triatomae]|uniref:NtaA/DmoA family FMN-dependent monooxygenase n=1 Tax=Rhodococcus triatomae TaxID=300028 RepID=UPI0009330C7A|nr:NtaA/DmoA family FMN-dependent monooxygenase [Rhodococcus triatomae]
MSRSENRVRERGEDARRLHIGLSLAPTWLSGEGWRREDSRVAELFDSNLYVDLARRGEAAALDFVFKPDSLFVDPDTLAGSPGFSSLDPTVLLATLARETSRIGLVTTASTTFNPPYVVARQLQSLHWASEGRAGWNIVTSLDGQGNFGVTEMPSARDRYVRAAEFTHVVRKLWESYPHRAIHEDRAGGVYADSAQVKAIDHQGEHFRVEGPSTVPTHPSGEIPLFQAGASPDGRDFAASVADAVFAASPDIEAGTELREDLRARAVAHGRDPDSLLVLPGLSMFLGNTSAQARELHRATYARLNAERRFASIESAVGLDLRAADPSSPVPVEGLADPDRPVRSRTHSDLFRRFILRERPTVAQLLERPEVVASAHWVVVGTPDDAVREIVDRVAHGLDGFIALPGGSWESIDLFFDQVIPRLVDLGLFRSEYAGRTLREHLAE